MSTPQKESGVGETSVSVHVRYWAGARAAAGVDDDQVTGAGTVGALVTLLTDRHPALGSILPVCSVLVEGRAGAPDTLLPDGAVVEVLPPFAGG